MIWLNVSYMWEEGGRRRAELVEAENLPPKKWSFSQM